MRAVRLVMHMTVPDGMTKAEVERQARIAVTGARLARTANGVKVDPEVVVLPIAEVLR